MSFLPPSPTLMNQAPLIADFTLSGPIVGPYRRGSDSSGQTLGEEGGQEGVGSISSKKTCQQNKILTNDRKDREIPPPFPSQHRVSAQFLAGGGITSLGLRFYNAAFGEINLSTLTILILTFIQRNSSTSARLPLSFQNKSLRPGQISLKSCCCSLELHTVITPCYRLC